MNLAGMNAVTISDLMLQVRVGYETKERTQPQDIAINLILETDFTDVLASNDVDKDGVNYSAIRKTIESLVRGREFKMLETLADEIFKTIFANKRIERATITMCKPQRWKNAIPGIVMTRDNQGSL